MNQNIQFLRKHFEQWPSLDCKDCHECCGVIRIAQEELGPILRLLAKKWYAEAPAGKWLNYCEYLDADGKCVVYEERPIICRVHGKMDSKFGSKCEKNNNAEKATVSQPPELLDYVENNIFFYNTAGERIRKKYR